MLWTLTDRIIHVVSYKESKCCVMGPLTSLIVETDPLIILVIKEMSGSDYYLMV